MKKKLILGQADSYKKVYDKSVLTPISRAEKRKQIGLTFEIQGEDAWNAYECTFLNKKGIPENYIGRLAYDCNSKFIIESKSLKLYLNGFDNKITTKSQYEKTVRKDLSEVLGTKKVRFELEDLSYHDIDNSFESHVSKKLKLSNYNSPDKVVLKMRKKSRFETSIEFHSDALRSLCPVTAQKDTGTVTIYIEGDNLPTNESLLELVVSFRDHQEFHEQCIERMFKIIYEQCQPEELNIVGNYVRRGGIDIVPSRYLHDLHIFENSRMARQ